MLTVENKAGWKFIWPDYSNYVEVYHRNASFSDQPVWAEDVSDKPRDMSTLNTLAFQTSDYAKPLES